MNPAQTNLSQAFAGAQEQAGIRVLSIAAEAHNQLGKVEKHGHLFEVVLQKVLDTVQPSTKEEYHQCIRETMSSKNETLNHHGLSPCQHVFGRNPRVPEDLVQETPCPIAATAPLHSEMHARSHNIRTAARVSMALAGDSSTLRTALNARPRLEREFLPGDFLAFWRQFFFFEFGTSPSSPTLFGCTETSAPSAVAQRCMPQPLFFWAAKGEMLWA